MFNGMIEEYVECLGKAKAGWESRRWMNKADGVVVAGASWNPGG